MNFMKRFLLLTLFISSNFAFSQVLTITDEEGNNVTNTTVEVEVLLTNIQSDNGLDVDYECHINNTSSSTIRVTLLKETNNIPTGSESYFCAGTGCYTPNQNTLNYDVSATSYNLSALHYKPRGSNQDATVTYCYTYTGSSSESRITVHYKVVDNTGIKSVLKGMNLSAFPNPANDKVEIAYKSTEASQIVLYNIVGTKVKSFNVSAGTSSIEIATDALPAGTYFYSLINKQGTETKRLVIKH